MTWRATPGRKQCRIQDLTIQRLQHSTYQCKRICAMCAWVGDIALRLAPAWHGFHNRLLAEFDRRNISTRIEFLFVCKRLQPRANYGAPKRLDDGRRNAGGNMRATARYGTMVMRNNSSATVAVLGLVGVLSYFPSSQAQA